MLHSPSRVNKLRFWWYSFRVRSFFTKLVCFLSWDGLLGPWLLRIWVGMRLTKLKSSGCLNMVELFKYRTLSEPRKSCFSEIIQRTGSSALAYFTFWRVGWIIQTLGSLKMCKVFIKLVLLLGMQFKIMLLWLICFVF